MKRVFLLTSSYRYLRISFSWYFPLASSPVALFLMLVVPTLSTWMLPNPKWCDMIYFCETRGLKKEGIKKLNGF